MSLLELRISAAFKKTRKIIIIQMQSAERILKQFRCIGLLKSKGA